MIALLQSLGVHECKNEEGVFYLRTNTNRVIATTNPDVVLGFLKSLSVDDTVLIEKISEKEYRERVKAELAFDVTSFMFN